ncbi:hypothetical protein ACFX2I_027026 [Malus domestica]
MAAILLPFPLVQRPNIKVLPENGLDVKLSGSGATGSPPPTLSPSPTMLTVAWRCERARDTPYEVKYHYPSGGL